jgi:hypothetical protein
MANVKISALTSASTPLAGTEVLPIVQSSATVKVAVSDLTAGRSVTASSFVASTIGAASGNALSLQSNGTTNVTLSTGGNLGIGVTPSAWDGVTFKAAQITSGLSLAGQPNTSSGKIGANWYWNGGYKYAISDTACRYDMDGNVHKWFNAASGTAGNTISFTQAMTLTAAGELLVGTTSLVAAGQVSIGYDSNHQGMAFQPAVNNTTFVLFKNASSSDIGSINTAGGSTTVYSTSSDYRLKENIAPMTGALATVSQLKPVTYTWKESGEASQGFIAHELQAIVPDAVVGEKDAVNKDGSIKPQGIDTSFLVATLTAAIQELKAEFDAYKTSHP